MELDKRKEGTSRDLQSLLILRDRVSELSNDVGRAGGLEPNMDLIDTGDAYRLIVDLPGVSQDDLEIALHGQQLTVAGLRETHDGQTFLLRERPGGHFQRTLELPTEVAYEASSAHLREGLLILHLPKA